jgi:hypothetical protein
MMLEKKTAKLVNHSMRIEKVDVLNSVVLAVVMKGDTNLAVKLILQKRAVN